MPELETFQKLQEACSAPESPSPLGPPLNGDGSLFQRNNTTSTLPYQASQESTAPDPCLRHGEKNYVQDFSRLPGSNYGSLRRMEGLQTLCAAKGAGTPMFDQTNKVENALPPGDLEKMDDETKRSWKFQTYFNPAQDNLNPWTDILHQAQVRRQSMSSKQSKVQGSNQVGTWNFRFSNLNRGQFLTMNVDFMTPAMREGIFCGKPCMGTLEFVSVPLPKPRHTWKTARRNELRSRKLRKQLFLAYLRSQREWVEAERRYVKACSLDDSTEDVDTDEVVDAYIHAWERDGELDAAFYAAIRKWDGGRDATREELAARYKELRSRQRLYTLSDTEPSAGSESSDRDD